ncbi:STAS domain-containing protein [Streptomyces sp. URMC 129]|uniref:STAS domain-containing protein n=1 Tax=Streptomyces sp. URMC 129 TaxID=3423407 RepID=UPI003F1B5332
MGGGEVFVVRGPVTRDDVPGMCERLAAHARRSGAAVLTVDVAALAAPPGAGASNAVTIEALARMRLTAKRLGCQVRFLHVGGGLQGLLGWLGLGEVGGQPEEREEPLGVQEGVDPGDAAV